MRKVKEILRLHYQQRLGMRQIGRSLSISHNTVSAIIKSAHALGLSWPLPANLDDATLESLLYPNNARKTGLRPEPDMEYIHKELRQKGVTLQLLWMEYKANYPDGYQYSQFCEHYRRWCQKLDVVMRQ